MTAPQADQRGQSADHVCHEGQGRRGPQETRYSPNFAGEDIAYLSDQARKASDILKALSHETRLLILWLLSEEEKTVSELERLLDLSQAAVSQQLARLRLDRLVRARREGRMIHYSICDAEIAELVASMYELLCQQDAGRDLSL